MNLIARINRRKAIPLMAIGFYIVFVSRLMNPKNGTDETRLRPGDQKNPEIFTLEEDNCVFAEILFSIFFLKRTTDRPEKRVKDYLIS